MMPELSYRERTLLRVLREVFPLPMECVSYAWLGTHPTIARVMGSLPPEDAMGMRLMRVQEGLRLRGLTEACVPYLSCHLTAKGLSCAVTS